MTPTTDKNGYVRWIANALQLPGYYLLIHDTSGIGLLIKGISDLLLIFWGISNKLWDVVAITGIFCVMNFQRLYEISQWTDAQHLIHTITQSLSHFLS